MVSDKFRFRFVKAGDLRLLSHLDLTRCLERMLRRTALPFKSTAGFHPTPRMIFALSLPLGVEGWNEVFELELTQPWEANDVQDRLNAQAPRGLTFTSAAAVPMKASAVPRRAVYTLPLPPDRVAQAKVVADRLMSQEKVWVDRYKPRPRRVNVRPYVRRISVVAPSPRGERLGVREWYSETPSPPTSLLQGRGERIQFDLWVTQTGTARLDELLKLLDLFDLLDAGLVAARSELEIRDETPPGQPDAPPDGPPETAPLDHTPVETGNDGPTEPEWGLSPNGPVVE
jgi:radical SAM-linked protein